MKMHFRRILMQKVLNESDISDISDMVKDFGSGNQNNGRMHIGSKRAKRLKGFVHRSQDFYLVSEGPTIIVLTQ